MKRRDGTDVARAGVEGQPLSAGAANAVAEAENGLRRGSTEANQDIRIGKLDLPQDKRQTDLAFLRRWRAVAGWPPWNDIGDIGASTIKPDRAHHQIEELARAADERQAGTIFVSAGRFADEHHACARCTISEHKLLGGLAQAAALEAVEDGAQFIERGGFAGRFARLHDSHIGRG